MDRAIEAEIKRIREEKRKQEEYKRMISKESHDEADGDQNGLITWNEHWNKAVTGHDFQDSQEQFEELMATEKMLFAGLSELIVIGFL